MASISGVRYPSDGAAHSIANQRRSASASGQSVILRLHWDCRYDQVEVRPRDIHFLEAGGVVEWLDELEQTDQVSYDAIVARLERVEEGNFGDYGPAGNVLELRFRMAGPGYRLYFGQHDDIVIILRAGTKKTQDADIKSANKLWKEYNDA